MVVDDETAAPLASDAEQAAYFRKTLITERERILETVITRAPAGSPDTAASQARRAEAEIRYIDRLIAGLDARFGPPS